MVLWLLGIGVAAIVIGVIWRDNSVRAGKPRKTGVVLAIAGALAVVAGFVIAPSSTPSTTFSGTSVADAPHETTGCSASRRAVEGRLKSPASVKWGGCRSTTAGGVQTVTLSADSQNGFGAMIRSEWVTTVRNNQVETVTQSR